MWKKPAFSVTVVTLYWLLYYFLYYQGIPDWLVTVMFLVAPFLMIWMGYTILRYGRFTDVELKDGEEWGYSDRNRDSFQ